MSDPFIGEIRAWTMNWAPQGWAYCNGQKMPINQAQALFAVISGLYGPYDFGAGTFTLPDLRGMTPMGAGAPNQSGVAQGMPSTIAVGKQMGAPTATLASIANLPPHTHQAVGAVVAATAMTAAPSNTSFLSRPASGTLPYAAWDNTPAAPSSVMNPMMVGPQGGAQPHENRQPFATVNFCIALEGVYPVHD